ncbi:hypothetical protein ACL2XO_11010 [Sodalis sp. RH15]|uniref:hypothetical protein n=1 Tax=Sodalis sp. RH15 TaxID=3394330 RepID=UPI0039B53CA3
MYYPVIIKRQGEFTSRLLYIKDEDKITSVLPMHINRFIEVQTPTEAELLTLSPTLQRKIPPSSQEVDDTLQRLAMPESCASMTGA